MCTFANFETFIFDKTTFMWITKLLLYLISFVIIGFPTNSVLIDKEELLVENVEKYESEALPLNDIQAQYLDSLLQRRLKRNGFRGTALVAYKNQILMQYAHGYADYRSKEKIGVESVFQLASVSKSFTATSIMILEERNLLNFDDLLNAYIPEFPYEDITINQLLQHTSGLQNYMYLVDNYWKNDSLISNEDVLDLLVEHHLPLNNRPGKRFIYSNTGYAMLALLVERVTDMSFGNFIKKEIFEPSGLQNTYTYSHDIMDTLSHKTIGYNRRGRRLFRYNIEPNDMILGDKSVYSTINDLFLYQKALNSYQLVKKSTLEKAYTKGITTSRYHRTFNYGYGWRLKEEGSDSLVYHNGLWHGFASTLTREMNREITVILLNNTTAGISAIRNDLLKIAETHIDKFIAEDLESNLAQQDSKKTQPNT